MTNAERQRRYRDKKRGGPSVGRWPDGPWQGKAVIKICSHIGMSKSNWYMLKWLGLHFPDVVKTLGNRGDGRESVSHAYRRIKADLVREEIATLCNNFLTQTPESV